MSLFVVRHQHTAESCPARDPQAGEMLIQHISPLNAQRHGINILGDAVIDGKHTFVLILEASDQQRVESFMQPFQQAGPVEIELASHCETVVARQGC